MNSKAEQSAGAGRAGDIPKLLLAAVVLIAGIVQYYYAAQLPHAVRVVLVVLAVAASLGIAAFTLPGRGVREFLHESQFEMRKVTWPTREQTLRTTLVVAAVVVAIALILGLIDWALKLLILDWLLKLGK